LRATDGLVQCAVQAKEQGGRQRKGQHRQVAPDLGAQCLGHLGPAQQRPWRQQDEHAQRAGHGTQVQRLAYRLANDFRLACAPLFGPDRQKRLKYAHQGDIDADEDGGAH